MVLVVCDRTRVFGEKTFTPKTKKRGQKWFFEFKEKFGY